MQTLTYKVYGYKVNGEIFDVKAYNENHARKILSKIVHHYWGIGIHQVECLGLMYEVKN